jgi:DNA-directed RNA polymerase specialized sigma24 family protein
LRRRLEDLNESVEFADAIPDESGDSISVSLERAELVSELKLARGCLPAADRLLLSLRFDDGLSAAEIATLLRYPSQFHVYRRINALLAELKERLKQRGYESAVS